MPPIGFPKHSRVALIPLALWAAYPAADAHAQVVDRVEVRRVESEAEIRVLFTRRVQYLRHVPLNQAESLRITLQVTGAAPGEVAALLPEVKKSPQSGLVSQVDVSFPESGSVQNDTAVLAVRFGKATPFRIRPGADGLSISIFVPATAAPEAESKAPEPEVASHEPTPSAANLSAEEVEVEAARLVSEAKTALERNESVTAVEKLNRALNFPPNKSSQEAQLLVGQARERNFEPDKARAEYELYLKLYPDAEGAALARERLAHLGAPGAPKTAGAEDVPAQWQVFGSWSQYYYDGKSQVDTTTITPTNAGFTADTQRLSTKDQSSVISNLDITARRRSETSDTRIVFRDQFTYDFLARNSSSSSSTRTPSSNRLNAAYVEHNERVAGWLARVGRQPGNTAGLLGRFDGGWLSYNATTDWKVSAVAGKPVEFGASIDKVFYGASVESIPKQNAFNGQLYFIQQQLQGSSIVDRQAVGTELRYFDPKKTVLGVVDYDVKFKALNIATVQGNYLADTGTSYFMQGDVRRAPPLQMTNVQFANQPAGVSTQDPVAQLGEAEVRRRAKAATPTTRLFLAGFTHPVSANWQLGADFRLTNLSSFVSCFGTLCTDAAGNTVSETRTPASGNSKIYSGQAIGTSVIKANDTLVFNASYIDGRNADQTYKGQSYAVTHSLPIGERWRVDGTLRYYTQRDSLDVKLHRLSPTLKIAYRVRDSVTLEAEGGTEYGKNQSGNNITIATNEKSRRNYFYVGYRWDFS